MTTVRDICERALRRIRVASAVDPVAAEDAAIARDVLNSMVLSWPTQGVEPFYSALALSDTFAFFVPPTTAPDEIIQRLRYQGTWNAATNTPPLASAAGTAGHFRKVATAGSTVLDDVTSWAAGDYVLFSGYEWLKCPSSARFDRAVVDMLALELCDEFGKEPTATLARASMTGWSMIQAAFIRAPTAILDSAIMETMTDRGIDEVSQAPPSNTVDVYEV